MQENKQTPHISDRERDEITERVPAAAARRERLWQLVKFGSGNLKEQSKISGFTVSRISDYRKLWSDIRAILNEKAFSLTYNQAIVYAKHNGIKTRR